MKETEERRPETDRSTAIIQLNADDLDSLRFDIDALGREFVETENPPLPFVTEVFIHSWRRMLQLGIGAVWGAFNGELMVGMMGAVKLPHMYSGMPIAQHVFWFVRKRSRGIGMKLFRRFEQWAKESGCKRIVVNHRLSDGAAGSPADLAKIYARRGYQPLETHYIKDVDHG